MADSSGGDQPVSHQLSSLVPSFDPAKDDMTIYQQKVELVLAAWPKTKISELVTRLILNCQGSAFQKLQLHQAELMENDEKSVKKVISLLGGQWGKVGLERRYQEAEAALFNTIQRQDESNDSYLARADVQWMKLLSQKLTLADLQAFIVLRGSQLSAEDKKRVILESDNSLEGRLTMNKVSESVRLLGAAFFSEMTGQRKANRSKVYEPDTLHVEEADPETQEAFLAGAEDNEEEYIDGLADQGDEDATLVADFEMAATETLQDDQSLAEALNAYQDARRRLSEKYRNRGFWPTSRSSPYPTSKGKHGPPVKGKGKSSFGGKSKRSLQDRILNSNCRICGRKGHWRAECPYRNQPRAGASEPSTTTSPTMPTTTLTMESNQDVLPLEFLNLPTQDNTTIEDRSHDMEPNPNTAEVFHIHDYGMITCKSGVNNHDYYVGHQRLQAWGFRSEGAIHSSRHESFDSPGRNRLRHFVSNHVSPEVQLPQQEIPDVKRPIQGNMHPSKQLTDASVSSDHDAITCFATHGAMGVLDLGASKTVIGSDHVPELLQSLSDNTRSKLTRGPCEITFRFGNQGTLKSSQALIVPIGPLMLRVAVVPGGTPFLLSNSLMRALGAQIDCKHRTLTSDMLKNPLKLQITPKGLFLINLEELVQLASAAHFDRNPKMQTPIFMSEGSKEKKSVENAELTTQETVSFTTKSEIRNVQFSSQITEHSLDPESSDVENAAAILKPGRSQLSTHDTTDQLDHDHVAPVSIAAASDSAARDCERSRQHDPGPTGNGSDRLRCQTQGPLIRRGMEHRSGLGDLDGGTLQQKHEAEPPQIHEVCGDEGGVPRTTSTTSGSPEEPCGEHSHPHAKDGSPRQEATRAKTQSHSQPISGPPRSSGRFRWRMGTGERDVRQSDYDLRLTGDRKCPSVAGQDAPHGECLEQSDQLHREPVDQFRPAVRVGNDDEAVAWTVMHANQRVLQQWVIEISKEFDEVLTHTKPLGTRWTLGEVFCSDLSPMTQQVNHLGGKAFRHGLSHGDLKTKEGRKALFNKIAIHRPKNIWFSPTCGPWSAWSQLNASLSMAHHQQYVFARRELIYQIALGVVLYRHQVANGDHFHWEQPARSLMFSQPGLNEIHHHTQICSFDMCNAGELRDPQNGRLMKKGMNVITTSPLMFHRLHGKVCDRQHEHQQLSGTTKTSEGSIGRTAFSEIYPRKFARDVAKVMLKNQERPFLWNPIMRLQNQVCRDQQDHPALAATIRVQNAREKFPKSTLVTPAPMDDPAAKKRRLTGKQTSHISKELCQQILDKVNDELPRVGKYEITSPTTLRMLQHIFPEKIIHRAIACRGTDRTLAPPQGMHPDEGPYRRTILLERTTGEIKYEAHWEKWKHLAKRQLVRPAHACRINVTVFGVGREPQSASPVTQNVPSPQIPAVTTAMTPNVSADMPSQPPDTTRCAEEPPSSITSERVEDPTENSPNTRFESLAKWEQQMLRQMHVNLGHPSNERFSKALQTQGYRPEVIQAAREMTCTVCSRCSMPKHQKPGTLKPILDFNHRVYLDGVTWTNHRNKSFHFYHLLDAGSNFHVAMISPANTTTDVINLIQQHWIQWAGPPTEMIVDSGTELNSHQMEEFFQSYGIRPYTTCPEAHWQSGKIERHGGFLQTMLNKIDTELPINTYDELQRALNQSTHAKNAISIRHGYSPEIIVFGKQSRLPGSILSDESIPSHLQAIQETDTVSPGAMQQLLKLRETARRAYHAADNHDALRRAILRRSCPHRGTYLKNQWVMIWRTQSMERPKWIGPQKVIIQDENHTVWTTQCGRLYRSAPENVRLAVPEEGHPEGPDLPEDMTALEAQIQRMQNMDTTETIPDEAITETNPDNSTNTEPELPNPPSEQPESNPSESSQQPDQEPEALNTPPESTGNQPSSDEELVAEHEVVNLLRHEPADALHAETVTQCAWRCEFDVNLCQPIDQHVPEEAESWILLATASKKQRTEVRLTELTPDERKEFDKAKQSEISNWIQTGTLSKVLRNQIPEEQILKCRWILTWKPLDTCGTELTQNNNHGKTHKAKARLVVLGYLDPSIEDIPRVLEIARHWTKHHGCSSCRLSHHMDGRSVALTSKQPFSRVNLKIAVSWV